MARRIWKILCCALITISIQAQMFAPSNMRVSSPSGGSAREFASPNGKFVLILQETQRANPNQWTTLVNAIVARRSGDEKIALWSTNLLSAPLQFLGPHEVLVSDSGDFALGAYPPNCPSLFLNSKLNVVSEP